MRTTFLLSRHLAYPLRERVYPRHPLHLTDLVAPLKPLGAVSLQWQETYRERRA